MHRSPGPGRARSHGQDLTNAAQKNSGSADAHYRAALAGSYLAEVAIEQKDKIESRNAAEAAIREAQKAWN